MEVTPEKIIDMLDHNTFRTIAYRIVRKYCGQVGVDDVLDIARFNAWKSISSFTGNSDQELFNWLHSIVRNSAINWIRSSINHTLDYEDGFIILELIHNNSAEEEFILVESLEIIKPILEKVMKDLSDKEHKLLYDRFIENKKLATIAKELRMHQSNITRALDKIFTKIKVRVRLNLYQKSIKEKQVEELMECFSKTQYSILANIRKVNSKRYISISNNMVEEQLYG